MSDQTCKHFHYGGVMGTPCYQCRSEYLQEEISSLTAELEKVKKERDEYFYELNNIANAKPSTWPKDMRDDFQGWAQSRARGTIGGFVAYTPADASLAKEGGE